MRASNEIQQGWDFAAQAAGTIHAAQAGGDYLNSVEEAILQMEDSINNHAYRNLPVDRFQGYVFEEYSAGTFNLDAIAAGSHDRAFVQHSLDKGSVDVRLDSGKEYSMKSYRTGADSAKQQAAFNPDIRQPLYKNQERMIPFDQLEEAKAEAARQALRNSIKRPDVSESYRETRDKLTDVIENNENIKSKPVTRKELDNIAKEGKKQEFTAEDHGVTPEMVIKTKYLLEQAGKAGLTAAAITMALQLAPEIIRAIDYLVRTGEIKPDQLLSAGSKAISAGGESFLRGSIAFAVTVAIKEGKLGVLRNLDPTIIGMLVVITLQTVKDSIMVAIGKMNPRELGASLVRSTIIVGGTTLGMAVVAKIGAATGQAICPVVGLVIGTLVGCTVSLLYDLGKKRLISFCVDSGFTCFGLVEQSYSLPEEALHEMGIETISIPRIDVPRVIADTVSCAVNPDRVQVERVKYTMLKRGIIGVNRIGYASAVL